MPLTRTPTGDCGSAGFARPALALELVTRFYSFGGHGSSGETGDGGEMRPIYWPGTGTSSFSSSDSALLVRLTHLLAPSSQLAVSVVDSEATQSQPASKPVPITAPHAPLALLKSGATTTSSSSSSTALELMARESGNFVLKVSYS